MTPWKVFYSYSHKDRELRDRLGVYLAPLRQQQKIIEWFDRDIEPGTDWREKISERIDDANLILLLVSPDFLASDYCFQIEVEKAIARFKRGEVEIIPIYLKECLWEDTAFGALQSLPGNPILSLSSVEEGMMIVAKEIRNRVSKSPPNESGLTKKKSLPASLDLVREQTHAYARLYERTRQRMRASNERTVRMEQIFAKMRDLAGASYPLLSELTTSPSPGEKLAAIAILQVFSTSRYFPSL